ncbi:MAG: SpoIIE family protein phosphatase [Kiritimatiellia bacterium]
MTADQQKEERPVPTSAEVNVFIEVDYFNRFKFRKVCSGDVFLSERQKDGSVVAVLTDGLGSGQQANVCSSLTATMAMEYIRAEVGLRRAATMIMDALPICPDRHISYSTFTMIHASPNGRVRMIEYENPPAVLLRGTEQIPIDRTAYTLPRWNGRRMTYATFEMRMGDRLFFCSDGITQAGLGTQEYPFGQGLEHVVPWLKEAIEIAPDIDAHILCKGAADCATRLDGGRAGDDTTASMLYYRHPRVTQILTGCPFDRAQDASYAALAADPNVRAIVSGGSTADLVARELHRTIDTPLTDLDPEIPASSEIPGIALVTEGCITLSKVIGLLRTPGPDVRINPATRMRDLLLASDRIRIDVGTAINPAHQDPNLPVALDIRRNIVRELSEVLRTRYFKDVVVRFH